MKTEEELKWKTNKLKRTKIPLTIGSERMSLEKALNKTYEMLGYKRISKDGRKRFVCSRCFPSILVGHKVRLVLADDNLNTRRKNGINK